MSPRWGRMLRAIGGLLALLVGGWLAAWHLALGALWWVAAAFALYRTKWRLGIGLIPVGVLLVPWCLHGYTVRSDLLADRVVREGPEALAVPDLFAVYGLNLIMGATGFVLGFPEVAVETLSLAIPHGREEVVVPSGLPLCAPKLARLVEARRALPVGASRETRVAWTYRETDASFRAALALNPSTVRIERVEGAVEVQASVPVDYPERSRLVFGAVGPLEVAVQEGLLHALEERGWLFPYTLVLTARLEDDASLPSPCEAWSVSLANSLR